MEREPFSFKETFLHTAFGIQLSLCMPGPSTRPPPPVTASPPPAVGRREDSGMKWGGREGSWLTLLWTSPLSQQKSHPIIALPGDLGSVSGVGARAEAAGSRPHLPSCGARGLEPLWGAPRGCWLCAHKGVSYPAGVGSMQNGASGHILPTCQAPLGSLCPCLCCAGDGEGRVS